jgi:chorismate synthase
MGNSLGQIFRVTTFGESHGGGVGVVIDGCPPGYSIDLGKIQNFLDRRRPGQSALSSPRNEPDQVSCLSGLEAGITLGTPLTLVVANQDAKSEHYADLANLFRPSHADFTTQQKYGRRPSSGGGRASARETIGRVAAAAVAEQILGHCCPAMEVVAFVESVKGIKANVDTAAVTRKLVDQSALRCPDDDVSPAMEKLILDAKAQGDSVGGVITGVIRGCPVGLGEPVFDKLEADLAKAMMSLPATKGFELGSGFSGTLLFGSEHNDSYILKGKNVGTSTNRSGGIQGGISNGEIIYFRVAFKPVATIFRPQATVDDKGNQLTMQPKAGRHDPCVLPRAVPMVEAMSLLVIFDHYLRQKVIESSRKI